jgi:sulfur carrier protein ThiS
VSDVTVTAPDQTVWWDVDVTVADVLEQLRLTSGDVDVDRITELVPAAGYAINTYLDRTEPLPAAPLTPAAVQAALDQIVVELYRRKDAGVGNPTDYTVAAVVARFAGGDVLADVRAQLQPFKQRWGIG